MKKLLLSLLLSIGLLLTYSIATAQAPSYYGYGNEEFDEYMDDLNDFYDMNEDVPRELPAKTKKGPSSIVLAAIIGLVLLAFSKPRYKK